MNKLLLLFSLISYTANAQLAVATNDALVVTSGLVFCIPPTYTNGTIFDTNALAASTFATSDLGVSNWANSTLTLFPVVSTTNLFPINRPIRIGNQTFVNWQIPYSANYNNLQQNPQSMMGWTFTNAQTNITICGTFRFGPQGGSGYGYDAIVCWYGDLQAFVPLQFWNGNPHGYGFAVEVVGNVQGTNGTFQSSNINVFTNTTYYYSVNFNAKTTNWIQSIFDVTNNYKLVGQTTGYLSSDVFFNFKSIGWGHTSETNTDPSVNVFGPITILCGSNAVPVAYP